MLLTLVALVVAFGAGYVYGKDGELNWKAWVGAAGAALTGFWDKLGLM